MFRAFVFSASFIAGLGLSMSTPAGAPLRILSTEPASASFKVADARHRAPRIERKGRSHKTSRHAARRSDPMVIPGIYSPAAAAIPAQEPRRQSRGFKVVPKAPSLLVVEGKPLPFQPGCTEDSNSDHLGLGWFKVVVTKTCFVR
ncbi:MAG: hypothetical protein Q7T73_17895 [Beijerinckiaceae bacterium]|nr:hypothetical protein [Beijerinckiaceae bacterium]